ncbi:hypothetical protein B0H14DRAFT_3448523 [Mycena olivaceomarginata]|nr:hypothetical protein B0H14DRAFT_3448523 [Mycena olivaceomarginata]
MLQMANLSQALRAQIPTNPRELKHYRTLKAFKLDLRAEINASALRTTYPSAAAAAPHSDRASSLLRQSAAHWVPKLAKNSSLIVPRCQIVVSGVPTTFNPIRYEEM